MLRFLTFLFSWVFLVLACRFNQAPVVRASHDGVAIAAGATLTLPYTGVVRVGVDAIDELAIVSASLIVRGAAEDILFLGTGSEAANHYLAELYLPLRCGETVEYGLEFADELGDTARFSFSILAESAAPGSTATRQAAQFLEPRIAAALSDGGLQAGTKTGEPRYYADGTAGESDIRFDPAFVGLNQSAAGWIRVAGQAVADDSGYSVVDPERVYHNVVFWTHSAAEGWLGTQTLPVDQDGRFDGYLYFNATGDCTVYAYRARNVDLYPWYPEPRTADVRVNEGAWTASFSVQVTAAVPEALRHLVPTGVVPSGTLWIRELANDLFGGIADDEAKVRAIYEFLGGYFFTYHFYEDIWSGWPGPDNLTATINGADFFVLRKGVCNDYAQAFATMARGLGYDVRLRSGWNPEDGAGHQWNVIDLGDGEGARNVDCTWAGGPGSYYLWADLGYYGYDDANFVETHDTHYFSGLVTEY